MFILTRIAGLTRLGSILAFGCRYPPIKNDLALMWNFTSFTNKVRSITKSRRLMNFHCGCSKIMRSGCEAILSLHCCFSVVGASSLDVMANNIVLCDLEPSSELTSLSDYMPHVSSPIGSTLRVHIPCTKPRLFRRAQSKRHTPAHFIVKSHRPDS